MPNKRKHDKCGISVYVPSEIKRALKAEADRIGKPMSELITQIYREKLVGLGYKIEKEGGRNG